MRLLPTFIDLLNPEGFVFGMFATGLTLAQAVGIIPISRAADRDDKRAILLRGLGLAVLIYAACSRSSGFSR